MPTEDISFVTPLGLGFTVLMGVLLLFLPRRYALVPVVILTCYMPMAERIIVLGLHFPMIRVLLLFGVTRVLIRRECRGMQWNPIDKAMAWYTLAAIVMHVLLWQTWAEFINRLGFVYDVAGSYFLFRFLIRGLDDITRLFKITAFFIVPLTLAMLLEHQTGRNVFVPLGGVPPELRDGEFRARGPFMHPSLAGTLGGSVLPFFAALWFQGNSLLGVMGVISSTIIVTTTRSSGPIMTYLASLLGLGMWFWRKRMRAVRWGIVLGLLGLHMVMKAPVWWIIMHMAIVPGSDAYHRSEIIDAAIRNFSDWWFVGTKSTEDWGYYLHDVTNQFIWEGVNGGLLQMVLFITIIVLCFRGVGRTVMGMEKEPFALRFCVWALGAGLFSHIVTFFSISYFDQNFVNWWMLLAMISTVSAPFISIKEKAQVAAAGFGASAEPSASSPVTHEDQPQRMAQEYWR